MSQQPLIYVSEIVIIGSAVVVFLALVLTSIYDIQAISRHAGFVRAARKLRYPRQPHVSVIVYAKNDAATIAACLDSIYKSRYRKYDVVVVDNVSSDETVKAVRSYGAWPSLRTCFKRKPADRRAVFLQGYARSEKGELAVCIDASQTIAPLFLKASAARFMANESLDVLEVGAHVTGEWGIERLIATLDASFFRAAAKCRAVLLRKRAAHMRDSAVYRSRFLKRKLKGAAVTYYDGSLSIVRRGTLMQSRGLSMTVLRLGVVSLVSYFFYVAATLQSSSLLMLSWIVVCIATCVTVFSDESVSRSDKARLLVSVPSVYFVLYGSLLVSIAAAAIRAVRRSFQWSFRFMSQLLTAR